MKATYNNEEVRFVSLNQGRDLVVANSDGLVIRFPLFQSSMSVSGDSIKLVDDNGDQLVLSDVPNKSFVKRLADRVKTPPSTEQRITNLGDGAVVDRTASKKIIPCRRCGK